jgi:aminoglycoside phosphotransferase (APT) family kinase protein
MQIESAIDSWQSWGGELKTRPVILDSLDGGRSNRSFLLGSNGKKMVLRLNGAAAALPGNDRSNELITWQAASKQGIAPPLIHVDGQSRYLVSAYIPNHLPADLPISSEFVDQALSLLQQCHQLNSDVSAIDYTAHIAHYWHTIEQNHPRPNPNLLQQQTPMQETLEALLSSNPATGLCHHDPVTANFVGSKTRLYLIDWEYAAQGLPIMDYAALGIEWGIDDKIIIKKTGLEAEQLTLAKNLYKYLCALWEQLTA